MLLVDRPWPTSHEYKSIKFIVDFEWGLPDSEIPISGRVQFETDPVKILKFHPSTDWNSFDEARVDIVAQAEEAVNASFS